MTGILDKYLEHHELNRYQLAKASGIPQNTWLHANERPIDRWTVKHVRALATCTGEAPSKVLDELEALDNGESQTFTATKS